MDNWEQSPKREGGRPGRSLISCSKSPLRSAMLKMLFDVFSRRQKPQGRCPKDVTPAFRNRVLLLCRDTFRDEMYSDHLAEFWQQVHQKLQYLHGSPVLAPEGGARNESDDAIAFLTTCSSDHFLDFIEYIFQVEVFWRFSHRAPELVELINSFFEVDGLPYSLTDYVKVQETNPGSSYVTIKVAAQPKVILREHALVHQNVTEPALKLLADPAFSSANAEFLKALEDYRKGDLGDCVVKCGSAFESVLKIICEKKRWAYQQSDTAAPLLKTVLSHTTLDPFFKDPLTLVATIRNRLSTAHGAGVQSKAVSPQVARFALNATATAILLLVEETR